MKATGIVRRIDDLGRVVIPKEIRRTMRIREGDPLEIYTERDGEVIFKKYSPMGELNEFAGQICESLYKTVGATALICDRDGVIAAAGSAKKELLDKAISGNLEAIMERRGIYRAEVRVSQPICEGVAEHCISVAAPILSAGDVLGCVVFVANKDASPHGETELKLAQAVAAFLGKQMEE